MSIDSDSPAQPDTSTNEVPTKQRGREFDAMSAQLNKSSHYLNPEAWKQLTLSPSLNEFCRHWLSIQCAMIANTRYGVIIGRERSTEDQDNNDNDRPYQPLAYWPNADGKHSHLVEEVAQQVLQLKKGAIQLSESFHCIGFPLANSRFQGAAVILIPCQQGVTTQRLKATMRQLQWGGAWFKQFYLQQHETQLEQIQQQQQLALHLTTAVLGRNSLKAALSELSTVLADQLGANRCYIAWHKKGGLRSGLYDIAAISHTANFDHRTNYISAMAAATQEALDQYAITVFPSTSADTKLITQQHAAYLKQSDSLSICTLPIIDPHQPNRAEQQLGAISIEHAQRDFFSEPQIAVLRQALIIINPLLTLLYEKERTPWQRLSQRFRLSLNKLFGPKHFFYKATAALLLTAVTLLSLIQAPYKVAADAQLEGWVQRSLTAPIDGYILGAPLKAGHIAKKGQRLLSLNDQDLLLEKLKWTHQKSRIIKQHRQAMVNHDQSNTAILNAQIQQAQAQINLLDARLKRLHIIAPFDGIIVSGDWSQQLGAPVNKGDTLLEIAPLNHYRIILNVNERNIHGITTELTGKLMLTAQPNQSIPFRVINVTPVAVVTEGENRFRIEAEPLDRSTLPYDSLRPGMRGTAKIDMGHRNLFWVWTHSFFDSARLWFWSWWPYV